MDFLYTGSGTGGYANLNILGLIHIGHCATFATSQCNNFEPPFVGSIYGAYDIQRVSGC